MKNHFEKEILQAQLEIQTQTFESISRELHDNVSNTISLALLNLNLVPPLQDEGDNKRIAETKDLMVEAKNSVRDFSWHINPQNLAHLGLSESLNHLVEKFRKLNSVSIDYSHNGEEFAIGPAQHIIIYRIAQEALSNIVKHARARKVELSLKFAQNGLQIKIGDDGCGFDTAQLNKAIENGNCSGIKNMISRSKMIDAELSIDAKKDKGTILLLSYSGQQGIVDSR